MAIELQLHKKMVPRLRNALRIAGTFSMRKSQALIAIVRRFAAATQMQWQRLLEASQEQLPSRDRTRQRKRAQLHAFEEKFEDLSDLLCLSAREGILPDRCDKYTRLRAWMRTNYTSIGPHLRPHWQKAGDMETDPFLMLFAMNSLYEAINSDSSIEDILRSRQALEAYSESMDASDI